MDSIKGAYDDILADIGDFGRFQKRACAALTLVHVTMAFNTMGYVFWGARPDHWCDVKKPPHLANMSDEAWKALVIPYEEETGYSQCTYYDANFSMYTIGEARRKDDVNFTTDSAPIKDCRKWKYDKTQYESTIVTQLDLVCSRFWLRSMSQSVYMAGFGLGLLIFGGLTDRYGRRKVILLTAPLQALATLALCFSRDIYSFTLLRFLQAATSFGLSLSAYVLMTELVGQRWRVTLSSLHMVTWSVAYASVAGIAYLIRDSFHLQLILLCSNIPYLYYYWIIPESPRWLLSSQKLEEFQNLVNRIATVNDKTLEQKVSLTKLNLDENETKRKFSCHDILRDPYLIVITIVQCYMWFTVSGVYFGLSLSASSLGGNDYLDTFISGIVELPAYLSVIFIYAKIGRKVSACLVLLLAGLTLGSTAFISKEEVILVMVVTTAGKFAVTVLFGMIYLYTSELFPTSIRTTGISICSLCARIASITAPFTVDLGEIFPGLPQILFAVLCLGASFSTIFLPETRDSALPQTMEEIKALSGKPFWMKCCASHEKEDKSTANLKTEASNSLLRA